MKSANPYHQGMLIVFVAFLIAYTSVSFAQKQEKFPTSFPGITLISPEQGEMVRPGQEVPVHLEIDEALNVNFVLIMGNMFRAGISLEMDVPPFLGIIKIPDNLAGPIELGVLVKNTSEKIIGGLGLNLNVVPKDVPQRIYTGTHEYLDIPPASYIPSRTISVKGIYDNGIDPKSERDISDISTGTTYRSSDTKVFTINKKGVMEPVAPGSAFVIVEHRGLKSFVAVDVRDKDDKKSRFPGVNHTADVSITTTQPRHKKDTVRYEMDVSIRNNAALPLHLPMYLVISDLVDGVRIADDRETEHLKPVGTSYVYVDVDEQSFLSPGNTARAKVIFINFDKKPLVHKLRLYAGGDV
jgi:hypothetical protein